VIPLAVGPCSTNWTVDERKERDPAKSVFPVIVFVPPASNIEDHELYLQDGRIRALVGKGQPGSVVRNLILRAADRTQLDALRRTAFDRLGQHIRDWFGVEVLRPENRSNIDQFIEANYRTSRGLNWIG